MSNQRFKRTRKRFYENRRRRRRSSAPRRPNYLLYFASAAFVLAAVFWKQIYAFFKTQSGQQA